MVVVILKTAQTTNGRIADVEVLNVENVKQKAKQLLFTAPAWNSTMNGTVVDVKLYAKFGANWVTIEHDEECKLLDLSEPIVFYCYPKVTDLGDLINEGIDWIKKEVDYKSGIIVALVSLILFLVPRGFIVALILVGILSIPFVLLYKGSPKITNNIEPQLPPADPAFETTPQGITATIPK